MITSKRTLTLAGNEYSVYETSNLPEIEDVSSGL